MGQDSLEAARLLLEQGYLRSSVSRAYYATYSVVTQELVRRGVSFPYGWNNPAHDQLPDLVLHNTDWPRSTRYEINKALRRLRRGREDADYRPGAAIKPHDALDYLRDASSIVLKLEIKDG